MSRCPDIQISSYPDIRYQIPDISGIRQKSWKSLKVNLVASLMPPTPVKRLLVPDSVLGLLAFGNTNASKTGRNVCVFFQYGFIVAHILGAVFDPKTSIWGSPGLHFGVPGLHFSTLGLHFGCLGLPRGSQAEKE